ncbi:MAG: helix-turn-helix transcriptional regulator [Clostridia bacterium]|nr:helix-turn-helix transcriptional regulator [Clostridia bacterium]MBR1676673.1 helix-turn-helix transcriptional regulator [Clostridia bacterium]
MELNIGVRIKDLRKEKNISQSELANAIGVSQKAIDYWERGVNEPKASYIVALADFFNVSADYLLGIKDY